MAASISTNAQTPAQLVQQIKGLLDQLVAPPTLTQPLIQAAHLHLVGAFRVAESLGTADGCGFSFAGGPIAASGRGTLYVGNRCGNLAELPIPITTVTAPLAALPVVSTLAQAFRDPTEGRRNPSGSSGTTPSNLGGCLALTGGRLHCAGSLYYDAQNAVTASHLIRSSALSAVSSSGWFPLRATWPGRVAADQMQGHVGGGLTAVPPGWQAALGGAAIASGFGLPIVTRESSGPNAVAFDPTVTAPTGTLLLGYPNGHETLGTYLGTTINPAFNMATAPATPVIVEGWRSLLFFGRTGLGVPCYGQGSADPALIGKLNPAAPGEIYCNDPVSTDKGGHAFPYAYYVWAYDLNDLAAVKAGTKLPWDVVPYASWPLVLPIAEPSFKGLAATVDGDRIYLMQAFADPGGGFFAGPIFFVLTVR